MITKNYTFEDADVFHVNTARVEHQPETYIKWEGYVSSNEDEFVIRYFDCLFDYTEWVESTDIYHTGNVSTIDKAEYLTAFQAKYGRTDCITL